MSEDICDCHHLGGAPGIEWVGAKDAPTENDPAAMSAVLRERNPALIIWGNSEFSPCSQ